MKVDISYNDELNGIELRFSEKPSAEIIQEVKKKMGFRYSKRQNMWYATRNAQRETFANDLQQALQSGKDPQHISIDVQPSNEPSEENIKHRKFSYVTIYFKDANGKGDTERFVLFEPSKNLALDIATQFAQNIYGDSLEKVYVYPRNYVREARKLLAAGKIITGTGKPSLAEKVKEEVKQTAPKILTAKEKLEVLSAFGKFHQKRKEEFPEVSIEEHELPIQFGSWLRANRPELIDQKESIWKEYHKVQEVVQADPEKPQIPESDYRLFFVRFTEYAKPKVGENPPLEAFVKWLEDNYPSLTKADKQGLTNYYSNHLEQLKKTAKQIERLSKPKKVQPYSAIFNKLQKVVPDLQDHLEKGYTYGKSTFGKDSGLMDLNLDVLEKDDKGRYVIALSHLYNQNGDATSDPDMQMRIDFEMETVEALTFQDAFGFHQVYKEEDGRTLVNSRQKKEQNKFLSGWLSNLIKQGHQIVWQQPEDEEATIQQTSDSENHSAIGKSNEDAYQFMEDFSGDVIYQMAVQGDMTVSEAQLLITESTELAQFIKEQFAKLESPTPVDAKKVASELLKQKAKKDAGQLGKPQNKKAKNQHELNKAIEQFIAEKDESGTGYTEEDKQYIAKYSGAGGLAKKGASGKGLLYEYFTDDAIVQKMWGLAFKYGYNGGAVLEPSCGTGNFFKYLPAEVMATGYEINPTSKRIAELLYPHVAIHQASFESIFFKGNIHLKDDFGNARYDLIIGNPPYGEFSGRYAGMGEKGWTKATRYEDYFITRGLDLLSPGGLLIYIIPSSFLKSGTSKVKEKIAEKIEPLTDGYRNPSGVFTTTDIGTDIIVMKKKK